MQRAQTRRPDTLPPITGDEGNRIKSDEFETVEDSVGILLGVGDLECTCASGYATNIWIAFLAGLKDGSVSDRVPL
jgi:hypothetical protein